MTTANQSHDATIVTFQNRAIKVIPTGAGPSFTTSDVAAGFGCTHSAISMIRARHADELTEGKHWVTSSVETGHGTRQATLWTQRGVVRLGFFLTSPRAKAFRDWAEDLVLVEATTALGIAPAVARLAADLTEEQMMYMLFLFARERDPELGDALFAAVEDAAAALRANERKRESMARVASLADRHLLAIGR